MSAEPVTLAEIDRRVSEQHARLKRYFHRLREVEKILQLAEPNPEEGRDDFE